MVKEGLEEKPRVVSEAEASEALMKVSHEERLLDSGLLDSGLLDIGLLDKQGLLDEAHLIMEEGHQKEPKKEPKREPKKEPPLAEQSAPPSSMRPPAPHTPQPHTPPLPLSPVLAIGEGSSYLEEGLMEMETTR